ncbi:hypothetical protein BJX70DRAFT_198221 [Aspergillus crustosus]
MDIVRAIPRISVSSTKIKAETSTVIPSISDNTYLGYWTNQLSVVTLRKTHLTLVDTINDSIPYSLYCTARAYLTIGQAWHNGIPITRLYV